MPGCALRGELSVVPELVQRVKQATDQLGYVPDPAARALASQRSNQVPALVPLLSNALFVDVLEAAHRTLLSQGFQTLISVTHYSPEQEEQLLRSYLAHRPAGLLLSPQPSSMRLGGELLQDLLSTRPDVDAVSICNDLSGSDQMVPPLTTVRTPRVTIGEASAHVLLGLIRGKEPLLHSLDLGFELVVRGSS